MGVKGKRKGDKALFGDEPTLDIPEWKKPRKSPKKTTSENSEHRRLCELGGKFLHNGPTHSWKVQKCPFVAIELVSVIQEIPDIFGWDYWSTTLIEVKTSKKDFLKDADKPFRKNPEQGIGMKRLYLCPQGLIKPNELPEKWGLLWENNGEISVIVEPELFEKRDTSSETLLYASVFRRCGIKPQVFDFRNSRPRVSYVPQKNEILLKWNTGAPKQKGFYILTVESDDIKYISKDYFDGKQWDSHEKKKVIAWMPYQLLKPYGK